MREILRIFAVDMELQENSIIVSDRLDGIFDVELRNHFTRYVQQNLGATPSSFRS